MMEHPIKMDDLGENPLFFGNTPMLSSNYSQLDSKFNILLLRTYRAHVESFIIVMLSH